MALEAQVEVGPSSLDMNPCQCLLTGRMKEKAKATLTPWLDPSLNPWSTWTLKGPQVHGEA